jgi:hypothetical protein
MEPRIVVRSDIYEHVSLDSGEWETIEPATIDAELVQSGGRGGKRITVFNGSFFGVGSTRTPPTELSHYVNLAFVDPRPIKRLSWPGRAAVAAVAILGTMTIVAFAQASADLGMGRTMALLAVIVATLACLGVVVRERLEELIFMTRHGRVPAVRLSRRGSKADAHREFVKVLTQAIERAHNKRLGDRGALLCDEMKEHRRLADEGLLTSKQFLSARSLILQSHDQ